MLIICFSVTHKKATVPMLESVAFKDQAKSLKSFISASIVKESIIVQTCNRVEAYFVVDDHPKALDLLVKMWSREVGVSEDVVRQVGEVYRGKEALLHLLNLASGLESMVVGEDQILGQVRKAYVESKKLGATGRLLEKIFMKAVNVGRRIRTETCINRGSTSISSVAVDLAEEHFGGFESTTAFVVGAGEAGSIIAEELTKRKVKKLLVTNRTYSRAHKLAKEVGGEAVNFSQLYPTLSNVNVGFVAVNAAKPLVNASGLENLPRHARDQLLIVDISQPRAVAHNVGLLSSVVLKNIDDLKEIVEANLQKRLEETGKAEKIIKEEYERLDRQLGRLMAAPLVSRIFSKVESIRRRELQKALRMLKGMDDNQLGVVEDLTKEFMERMVEIPAETLREAAMNNDGHLLSAAEKLFKLEKEEK